MTIKEPVDEAGAQQDALESGDDNKNLHQQEQEQEEPTDDGRGGGSEEGAAAGGVPMKPEVIKSQQMNRGRTRTTPTRRNRRVESASSACNCEKCLDVCCHCCIGCCLLPFGGSGL